MISLPTSNFSLEIDLDAAVATNQLPYTLTYININQNGNETYSIDHGTTNSTTAVTMGVPAATERHLIQTISVHNADTATRIVTIQLNDNGTLRTIMRITLLTLETLFWSSNSGWQVVGP